MILFAGHVDWLPLLLRHPRWSDGLEGRQRGLGQEVLYKRGDFLKICVLKYI